MPTLADDGSSGGSGRRERLLRSVGVVTWVSFLIAGVQTMVFFAFVDPALPGSHDTPSAWAADRMAGYTLGFFLFWGFTFCAAALTAYLQHSAPQQDHLQIEQRKHT